VAICKALKSHGPKNFARKTIDRRHLSYSAMAVGPIALACVAGETAVSSSVNRVFVSIATVIANGIAQ